jgi:hypothetical protein
MPTSLELFWLKRGEIYLDKYAGWYAVRDEAYYSEDELSNGADGKKDCSVRGRSRMDGRGELFLPPYLHGVTNCWNFMRHILNFVYPKLVLMKSKVLCAAD